MEVKHRPRGRPRKKRVVVKSRLDELDMVLWLWYQQKCEEQRDTPVYGWMICDKAREFYGKLKMTETVSFCPSWLESFRSRHGITARKNFTCEKYSAGEVDGYQSQFAELVTRHQLTADRIYNVDETGLFWRRFPSGSLSRDGESQDNKDRLTVLCCANAAGTHRCKLMVIGNSVEPKGLKNLPIIYRVHKDSYINQVLFQDWFYNHFVPEVKKNFIKMGRPADSTALLLLDKSNAHPRLQDLRSGNIFAEFLPDSKTGLIQPMEQGVVWDMKAHYRKTFIQRLIAHKGSMEEFNKTFTIKEAISDITKAWELVTNSGLKKSWRKLWPNISFIDSDDEEFEGFKPKRISKRNSLKQEILDHVKVIKAPEVKKMLESENLEESIDKWLDCDDDAPTTDRLTNHEVGDSLKNPNTTVEMLSIDSDDNEDLHASTSDQNPTIFSSNQNKNNSVETDGNEEINASILDLNSKVNKESINKLGDHDKVGPMAQCCTEDDLIEIVRSLKTIDETDSDDSDNESPLPTLEESLKKVETLIRFMESRKEFTHEQIIEQYQIEKILLALKIQALEQHPSNTVLKKHIKSSPSPSIRLPSPIRQIKPLFKRKNGSDGESMPKKKRNLLMLDEKVRMLDFLARGDSNTSVARRFGINSSTLQSIKKCEKKIRDNVESSSAVGAKMTKNVRNSNLVKMETHLNVWIEDMHQRNITFDRSTIRKKASMIYKSLVSSNGEDSNAPFFAASSGWFFKFMKRYGLHDISMGETEYLKAAQNYASEFKQIIEEGEYLPEQVFNADEMTLFWKRMPERTYISKNERCAPGFKAAKDRLTILLCTNAKGDCIIMPMLLYHSFNPRALKNKDKDNMSVFWRFNKNSWLNRSIFREWFHQCFVPGVEGYLKSKQLPFKALLLLDNAPTHPHDLTHSYPNIKVEFLPPQMAPILQPLNQGVTDAFKRYYTLCTFRRVLSSIERNPEKDLDKCWKEYNIAHCIENVREAIDEVTESTINACWKKLWSEAGNDFSMLPDIEEEVKRILRLSRQFGGEGFADMQQTEVEELLASHHAPPTIEEVEEMLKDDETDKNDPVDSSTSKLNLKNLSQLKADITSVIERYSVLDPMRERSTKFKRGLEELFEPYNKFHQSLLSCKPALDSRFFKVESSSTAATTSNTIEETSAATCEIPVTTEITTAANNQQTTAENANKATTATTTNKTTAAATTTKSTPAPATTTKSITTPATTTTKSTTAPATTTNKSTPSPATSTNKSTPATTTNKTTAAATTTNKSTSATTTITKSTTGPATTTTKSTTAPATTTNKITALATTTNKTTAAETTTKVTTTTTAATAATTITTRAITRTTSFNKTTTAATTERATSSTTRSCH